MVENYPASDRIELLLSEIEDLWSNPALLQEAISMGILSLRGFPASNQEVFDPSVGRELYEPSETAFSHFRKLGPQESLQSLRVVRVEVYDEDTDDVTTKEFNPNDPEPLFEAYRRILSDRNLPDDQKRGVEGSLEKFSQFRTTSAISMHFEKYIDSTLESNFLSPSLLQSNVLYAMDEPTGKDYSAQFKMMYPDFYRKFREVFIAVNNHALIKLAVEKNREFDPVTQQPFTSAQRSGFTWNRLDEIAKNSAEIAFGRAKEIYAIERRYNKDVEFVKSASSRIERDIKAIKTGQETDVSFLKSFVRQSGMKFKVNRETEDSKMAMRRFTREYREFAGKRLDELEKNRGLQIVLAIAVARRRGNETVSNADMSEAAKRILEARKNPGTFTSARKMIDSITGNDNAMTSELMLMLDRRRSFARNLDKVARFGQTASRLNAGDARVSKAHIEEGKRFAASTFLRSMVKHESVAHALTWEFKRKGFSSESALRANVKLSKETDRLLNHLRKEMTRGEAYRNEKGDQALQAGAPKVLKDSLGDEFDRTQGPDPDPSPSHDTKPRR